MRRVGPSWPMILRLVRRYAVALGYLVGLVAGEVALVTRSAADRAALLSWASTNIDNLAEHPIRAIALSAFLPDGDLLFWVAAAAAGLLTVNRRLGNLGAALLMVTAHLAGTAAGEGITRWRIATGALPPVARQTLDVGPSFVVVAGLVAALAYGQGLVRRGVALLAFAVATTGIFDGLWDLEVAPVGHVVAIVVGLAGGGLGVWLSRRRSRRREPVTDPVPP